MNKIESFIANVPKAELHVHIEGTLEPELKFALAKRNGLELPYIDVDEMKAAYDFDDLPSFLSVYYEGMSVLKTEDDFFDLTMAYMAKAHEQNVVYVEMFFDPQAHTSRGIRFETVINGIRRGQEEAKKLYGIQSNLIMCFLRDMSAEYAMATLMEALSYEGWIIGVGLDSDERNNPPIKFQHVFERARQEGFLITIHCDVDQDNSTTHIRQCLYDVDVNRIDHGVNSLDDEKLVDEIKRRKLGLTVCPISNKYVTGSLKAEEIKTMLRNGMLVTVNSDDPAYFPGYMNENLSAVHQEVDLDEEELPADIDPELRHYIDRTRDQLCREPLSRLAEYDKLSRQLINHE